MSEFVLNPRLVTATFPLGDLPLCRSLLLNDRRYPWVLLVPRRQGMAEIVDLAAADRALLIEEIALVSEVMRELFQPSRLNVADIGNKAPQLHVHVVARRTDDEAWPEVVWSRPLALYRESAEVEARRAALVQAMSARTAFTALEEHADPGVERL